MVNGQDSLRLVRRRHEAVVLDLLAHSGPLSRRELVERTGLSRTTLLALVTDLLSRGALTEIPDQPAQRGRGRPLQRVALNPRGGLWIGIDVGHGRVRMALANAAHEVITREQTQFSRSASVRTALRATVRLIDRVCTTHEVTIGALRGIAAGLVGIVEEVSPGGGHTLTREAKMFAQELEERYSAPVVIDNNVHLATYAEAAWGAARGRSHVLYLRLSDGVGTGLVIGETLLRGAHGAAGETGHVTVDPKGRPCRCGRRGCLEMVLGIPALISACAEKGLVIADRDELIARAVHDRVVRQVIRHAIHKLLAVLVPLVAQVDPAAIVVGGELSELDDLVLEPIRRAVSADPAFPSAHRTIDVVPAGLGPYAGALGGLALMLNSRPELLEPIPGSGGLMATADYSDAVTLRRGQWRPGPRLDPAARATASSTKR